MPRTWRGRGPGDAPGWCQDVERAPHSRQAGTPAAGGPAHDPPCPSLTLPLPSARGHPELHKPARPAAPLYAPPLKRVPRGRSLKPCVAFSFTFLHLEERTVFDSALFMFLLGNKRWLCACVFFLCWFFFFFFKEIGRRKRLLPFLAFCPRPLRSSDRHPSTFPPHPFCFFFPFSVLFCYESTFLFVIFGSPGFLFSVKSPYASSALRLLLPPPGPDWLCEAWPAPLPPRLLPSSPSQLKGGELAPGRGPHLWRGASAI